MVAASKLSAKKLRANRRNARKSTGPRTLSGKARSSQNARTDGAFCQYVVLELEDVPEFNRIRRSFIQRLRPQDLLELSLVERIAEGTWRLMRLNRQEWEQEKRIREFACEDEWHGPWAAEDATDLSPARQRVEQSISRAMRELRLLQSPAKPSELPESPYWESEAQESIMNDDCSECDRSEPLQNPQNEPTAEEREITTEITSTCEPDSVSRSQEIAPPARVGLSPNEAHPPTEDDPHSRELGGEPTSE